MRQLLHPRFKRPSSALFISFSIIMLSVLVSVCPQAFEGPYGGIRSISMEKFGVPLGLPVPLGIKLANTGSFYVLQKAAQIRRKGKQKTVDSYVKWHQENGPYLELFISV